MPSSRGSSRPRDWTHVSCGSCIAGRFLYWWATREVPRLERDPINISSELEFYIQLLMWCLHWMSNRHLTQHAENSAPNIFQTYSSCLLQFSKYQLHPVQNIWSHRKLLSFSHVPHQSFSKSYEFYFIHCYNFIPTLHHLSLEWLQQSPN